MPKKQSQLILISQDIRFLCRKPGHRGCSATGLLHPELMHSCCLPASNLLNPNLPPNNPPNPLPLLLPLQLMLAARMTVVRAAVVPTQFHELLLLGQEEIHIMVLLWHQQPMDVTGPLIQTGPGKLKISVCNFCLLRPGSHK